MFFHDDLTKDLNRAKRFFEDILAYTIGPFSLEDIIENNINTINILDVREYENYIDGHIPYAVHIPYRELEQYFDMLNKDKITVVYTYTDSCPRAYKTALALVKNDYPAVVLRGGYKQWKKFDFDTVKNDSDDFQE